MSLPPRLAHLAGLAPAPRPVKIYELIDPGDGKARWIGSSLNPEHRAWQHWNDARLGYTRSNQLLYEWLISLDKPPESRVLDEVREEDRWQAEAEWTRRYLGKADCQLFNIMKGRSPH